MMTQFATLAPQAHLDEAVQTLLHTGQGEFPVVDGAGKPVGVLGRADLIRAIKTARPRRPRRRRHDRRSCRPSATAPRSSRRSSCCRRKQAPAVGVTDATGRLIGLVTGETIAEMMMLQDAHAQGRASRALGPAGRGLTGFTVIPAAGQLAVASGRSVTILRRNSVRVAGPNGPALWFSEPS